MADTQGNIINQEGQQYYASFLNNPDFNNQIFNNYESKTLDSSNNSTKIATTGFVNKIVQDNNIMSKHTIITTFNIKGETSNPRPDKNHRYYMIYYIQAKFMFITICYTFLFEKHLTKVNNSNGLNIFSLQSTLIDDFNGIGYYYIEIPNGYKLDSNFYKNDNLTIMGDATVHSFYKNEIFKLKITYINPTDKNLPTRICFQQWNNTTYFGHNYISINQIETFYCNMIIQLQ